jgi:hypothetical protein
MLIRDAKPLAFTQLYNASVPGIIYYDGNVTPAKLSLVTTTFTLKNAGATTATIDVSQAANDDWGELKTAIEANAGWHLTLVGALRADPVYASNLKIATFSEVTLGKAGKSLLYGSNARRMAVAIGREADTDLDAAARQSEDTIPWIREPGEFNKDYHPATAPFVQVLKADATFSGGGTATWTIARATQAADGGTIFTKTGAATGAPSVLNADDFGAKVLELLPGERLVAQYSAGADITAGSISVINGGYGEW